MKLWEGGFSKISCETLLPVKLSPNHLLLKLSAPFLCSLMASHPHHLTSRCCAVLANNTSPLPRRPSTSVFSVLVPITTDENTWTEVLISKGTWVLMQPRGGKRKRDGSVYKWAWKGRAVDFRIPQGKTTVKEVLVQHVYMHHQIVMAPGYGTGLPTHRPNCKFDLISYPSCCLYCFGYYLMNLLYCHCFRPLSLIL